MNPLASPSAGVPALKYRYVNTETSSPGEAKGLIDAGYGVNNILLKYTEIKDLLKDNKYKENILDNIFKVEDVADESPDADEIIE